MAIEREFWLSRESVIKALNEILNKPNVIINKNGVNVIEIKDGGEFFANLACALLYLKDPVEILNPSELRQAYWKQQKLYDYEDIENEIDINFEYYDEKFGIEKAPITESEKERMVSTFRDYMDKDVDGIWSVNLEMAITRVLMERAGCE